MFSFLLLFHSLDRTDVERRHQVFEMIGQVERAHDSNECIKSNALSVFHPADRSPRNTGLVGHILLADILHKADGFQPFAYLSFDLLGVHCGNSMSHFYHKTY